MVAGAELVAKPRQAVPDAALLYATDTASRAARAGRATPRLIYNPCAYAHIPPGGILRRAKTTESEGASMPRIEPLDADAATGKARELLDEYVSHGGDAGPMVR